MNQTKVFLLIDGERPETLPDLSSYDLVCATDGAYRFLMEKAVVPDFISGDFDSLEELPKSIEVIETPDQNYTDFEKILKILFERGYKNIHVFGASGKEQDHFLSNLHIAMVWRNDLNLIFFDNYGYYFLAENTTEIKNSKGKTVSLIPFPEAKGITTQGLKYPLTNSTLIFGEKIGERNLAIANHVTIRFNSGFLFVFVNKCK
ncbi:thiamine diphosphokinase [Tamlana crocina]|uniref:Thiamine diphosphokinase n=1 Tax=Tamlana crocina TaxID=393006 RepID=A0ABX1DD30_9FLAO|nr:thiamine diphosphokinase [Tamlana crocina]NJX16269.1 thiamine diphosphokinase [Tamlana crocina]